MTTPRQVETFCGGCLKPCWLPEPFLREAIAGKRATTFYCNDDLAIPGVAIRRPEGACVCGNPHVIVPMGPSDELWLG